MWKWVTAAATWISCTKLNFEQYFHRLPFKLLTSLRADTTGTASLEGRALPHTDLVSNLTLSECISYRPGLEG